MTAVNNGICVHARVICVMSKIWFDVDSWKLLECKITICHEVARMVYRQKIISGCAKFISEIYDLLCQF